jgi:hypothetical protein
MINRRKARRIGRLAALANEVAGNTGFHPSVCDWYEVEALFGRWLYRREEIAYRRAYIARARDKTAQARAAGILAAQFELSYLAIYSRPSLLAWCAAERDLGRAMTGAEEAEFEAAYTARIRG